MNEAQLLDDLKKAKLSRDDWTTQEERNEREHVFYIALSALDHYRDKLFLASLPESKYKPSKCYRSTPAGIAVHSFEGTEYIVLDPVEQAERDDMFSKRNDPLFED